MICMINGIFYRFHLLLNNHRLYNLRDIHHYQRFFLNYKKYIYFFLLHNMFYILYYMVSINFIHFCMIHVGNLQDIIHLLKHHVHGKINNLMQIHHYKFNNLNHIICIIHFDLNNNGLDILLNILYYDEFFYLYHFHHKLCNHLLMVHHILCNIYYNFCICYFHQHTFLLGMMRDIYLHVILNLLYKMYIKRLLYNMFCMNLSKVSNLIQLNRILMGINLNILLNVYIYFLCIYYIHFCLHRGIHHNLNGIYHIHFHYCNGIQDIMLNNFLHDESFHLSKLSNEIIHVQNKLNNLHDNFHKFLYFKRNN